MQWSEDIARVKSVTFDQFAGSDLHADNCTIIDACAHSIAQVFIDAMCKKRDAYIVQVANLTNLVTCWPRLINFLVGVAETRLS